MKKFLIGFIVFSLILFIFPPVISGVDPDMQALVIDNGSQGDGDRAVEPVIKSWFMRIFYWFIFLFRFFFGFSN